MARTDTAIPLLINSPDSRLAESVRGRLSPFRFAVSSSRPGLGFMEAARRYRPVVAVIDRIHERPDAAQMEVAFLKELRPDIRIVAISQEPSAKDGWVVEQGIFYYMTVASGAELIRVLEAAAGKTCESTELCP